MQTSIFRRGLSLMLALTALLALGLTAKAETQETTPAIVALKAEHVTAMAAPARRSAPPSP